MVRKGIYITIEGNEGAGKGTLINNLKKRYCSSYPIYFTREPGGSVIGEKVRKILIDNNLGEMDPLTELLLYIANRNQNIKEIVSKKIDQGYLVISDRGLDSSVVYQGAARKIDLRVVNYLNNLVVGKNLPNYTIILLVRPEVGLQRVSKDGNREVKLGELDRLEREKLPFHQRLFRGYKKLARTHRRFVIIDTTEITPEEVFVRANKLLKDVLNKEEK